MSLLHSELCGGSLGLCSIGERNVLVVMLSEGHIRLALDEPADTVIIWLLSSWYQSNTVPGTNCSLLSSSTKSPALMQQ